MYDYHVHSNYSDGSFLYWMLSAAEDAGLDGVGFADHCNVSAREAQQREKFLFGFTLDATYDRRRAGIEAVRDRFDLRVYDAVEMDYVAGEEDRIADFLDEAGFDYAIGSVHSLDDRNVQTNGPFRDLSPDDRRAVVDDYYETLAGMVESELFAVAAHPDLLERNEHLRGLATEDHYDRVARAFADSRTVPEVNAGRVLSEYGEFHPAPAFFEAFREYDVGFTLGTDSHRPDEIAPRTEELDRFCSETGLEPVELDVPT
ncbi:PHP domain-containing protein [Halomarina litorea]|uniref:PHP domain-containing protein n=1 Tax=Halomarina litorea TaxID=2961595 RepID=UPI0020C51294|nr:PHP domain-containing protein [Halomarina sp. BCD28]